MTIRLRGARLAMLAAALTACGTTGSSTPSTVALDRPIDVAFACFGNVRMISGGPRAGTKDDPFQETAAPMAMCDAFAAANGSQPPDKSKYPLGQEDLTATDNLPTADHPTVPSVRYYALILESVAGTLAVAAWTPKPAACKPGATNCISMQAGDVQVQDVDPLQPGASGISVGDLPIGVVTDQNGCFAVTANAGTCDLSSLDITSALATSRPKVDRLDVTNGSGAKILAKPAAIVAPPVAGTIGAACPASASGIIYVAYPACHRVAAIDSATGKVQSSIVFDAAGNAAIDPDTSFTCPAECGVGALPTAGTRPTTLSLVDDLRTYGLNDNPPDKPAPTRRLAIGADNSNKVTVIDLDANHLPTGTPLQVALAGSIGITDVALTQQIGMGGSGGLVSDDPTTTGGAAPAGQFQFVYAVATDGTVRVADVLSKRFECDTEIDPRSLTGVMATPANLAYLSCIPIGAPIPGTSTVPPRRAGVKGPGIQLIGAAKPIAVAIAHPAPDTPPSMGPRNWIGYFAVITSSVGLVYVANIDDDNYPDAFDPTKPLSTWLPLALPHQLRDSLLDRSTVSEQGSNLICDRAGNVDPDSSDPTTLTDGPHLWPISGQLVPIASSPAALDSTKEFELPSIHQVLCSGADKTEPVSQLGFSAPVADRLAAFPDLRALRDDETWLLTWEGPLSNDGTNQFIDGPITRIGQVIVDGTGMRVVEDTHPFCQIGAEPFDEVILRGCDQNVPGECGIGNTCYVDPASPSGVGSCLPSDQVDALSPACHEFLISQRRYAATTTKSGELRIIPRRHVLRTTPVTGCTSSDQCTSLEAVDLGLPDANLAKPEPHSWSCEADPSRPGPNQCVMTCQTDLDCGNGTKAQRSLSGAVCDAGRCVEGVVPPLQCVTTLQRYEVHASRAFVVIGNHSGYIHPIIADANGNCVKDPNASPYQIGRIPLTAPDCSTGANPCSTTVTQAEIDPDYADLKSCQRAADSTKLVTRQAPAIRFSNPMMTFEMVDPTYPGDLACLGDRMGNLMGVPIVFPGFAMQFRIVSGFRPYVLELPVVTSYPIKPLIGPLESIWIADEGDYLSPTSISTRGRVFRVESLNPVVINILQ